MRRSSIFWGALIILVGVLLLLSNLGVFDFNVWNLFWPLTLIAVGLWLLLGILFGGRGSAEALEEVTIPLEGAGRGAVRVRHGAGMLRIDADADPQALLSGTFAGGLDARTDHSGDLLSVDMRVPQQGIWFFAPWQWWRGGGLAWAFGLSPEVPISLRLETGAGEAKIDLTDLQVTDLRLQTGASSTRLALPAQAGHTQARIEGGAASISVRVPTGVAAQIETSGGLASISVDRDRFPRHGGVYQSPDYETAENTVDLRVDIGAGSISIS
jgi:hypothetical protein